MWKRCSDHSQGAKMVLHQNINEAVITFNPKEVMKVSDYARESYITTVCNNCSGEGFTKDNVPVGRDDYRVDTQECTLCQGRGLLKFKLYITPVKEAN